ncbi:904_t:CDS:2, partial [Gigaspora margarita]
NDGCIIKFGSSSANYPGRSPIIRAHPDVAVLNTNISLYQWSIPNISLTNYPQSLCFHSTEIYNNIMIIAFGIITSDQLQTTLTTTFNKNIYLFDVQNYAWIPSTALTSTKSTNTNNHSNYMIIGISIGVSGFIIILSLIVVGFKYKKFRKAIIEMP